MTHDLLSHVRQCAAYNRGANERLYAACAQLSDADRRRNLGSFFGSIHGTLNHIIVGDRIWMGRFAGETVPSTGLDAILYDDFAALAGARVAEDRRIEAFFAGLDAAFFDRPLTYVNNQGRRFSDPATVIVPHFFNHQTHHRGQVHAMITQLDRGLAPVLDMHRVLIPNPKP
ncbi:MAG: DinB family protein [Alphaproteobacteria bacterium]